MESCHTQNPPNPLETAQPYQTSETASITLKTIFCSLKLRGVAGLGRTLNSQAFPDPMQELASWRLGIVSEFPKYSPPIHTPCLNRGKDHSHLLTIPAYPSSPCKGTHGSLQLKAVPCMHPEYSDHDL